jgi:hypothetical protein
VARLSATAFALDMSSTAPANEPPPSTKAATSAFKSSEALPVLESGAIPFVMPPGASSLSARLSSTKRRSRPGASSCVSSSRRNFQALVARLGDRQAHAEALERLLAAKAAQAPVLDRRQLEQRLRAKLEGWKGLLGRNVAEGRSALRALLVGPLRLTPISEERRRGYAFEGTIALDRLLSGVIELPTKMASPTGFDDLWNVSLSTVLPQPRA